MYVKLPMIICKCYFSKFGINPAKYGKSASSIWGLINLKHTAENAMNVTNRIQILATMNRGYSYAPYIQLSILTVLATVTSVTSDIATIAESLCAKII